MMALPYEGAGEIAIPAEQVVLVDQAALERIAAFSLVTHDAFLDALLEEGPEACPLLCLWAQSQRVDVSRLSLLAQE